MNQINQPLHPLSASPPTKSNNPTCLCCRIKFVSLDLQREHFKTEWHSYNLKRKVCKLDPIDFESFKKIQEAQTIANVSDGRNHVEEKDNDDDDDEDWVDEDELIDGEYNETEAAEMLARVVKPNTCLFCEKISQDIKHNVGHMHLMHGFFIPEEQYLDDLEGFMEYLGFKVGAGCTCLWCNKQFKSLHGVRLHMIYKDHCKILYDQQHAIDEFKDFYDYSTQEQIPMNQLVQPKRTSAKHELVKAKSTSKQLIQAKNPLITAGTYQSKGIVKFNTQRAKTILRIGISNNNAMRGRLRQQNPL